MNHPSEDPSPPRPAAATPGPPARGDSGKTVYLLDPMSVRDLAVALQIKPFKVIADLLALKLFKSPDDLIDFATAAAIARRHGFRPERPPPGVLVL